MRRLLLIVILLLVAAHAHAQMLLLQLHRTLLPPPSVYLDFTRNWGYVGSTYGTAASFLTVVRTTAANMTDLGPWSPPGATFNTFSGANTPRITPGVGLLIEGIRSNFLTNAATPATQTSIALTSGTAYLLWVNGSGSATTATTGGCGAAAVTATQGNPAAFTAQASAGCTVTVTGSLNAFQLEATTTGGPIGSSLITTAGVTVLRQVDVITVNTPPPTNAAGYTVMTKAIMLSPDGATNAQQATIQVSDGTNTNRSMLFRIFTSNLSAVLNSGGVSTQVSGLLMHGNVPIRHASAVAANSEISTQDGANPGTSFIAFTPFATGLTAINLGGNVTANSQPCYCYIQQVQVWPNTVLTASQLQRLTRLSGQ